MRRNFFLGCFLAFLLMGTEGEAVTDAAIADKIPVVKSVDFYPSGARFVFEIRDHPEKAFEFYLPGAFELQSVRPLAQGEVTALRVDSLKLERREPLELEPLKRTVGDRSRELALLRGRERALEQALSLFDAPLSLDVKDPQLLPHIDNLYNTRFHFESQMVDAGIAVNKAEEALKKAEEELESLENELEVKRPYNDESILRVRGAAAASGPILFEAYTPAARWTVRYNMDLNGKTGMVAAKMRAQAWQKTGLDVNGEFSFHTRHPSFAVVPYNVAPLRVDLMQARPEARAASDMFKEDVSYSPGFHDALPSPSPEPVMDLTPVDIAVRGTGELKGDGTQEDIALGNFQLRSDVLLVSVPEQNSETWIVASMDSYSPSAMPLLPGPADLAVDGASSGKTDIPAFGLQGQIPFGMASRLTSRKEPLVSKTGTSWTGKGVLEDGYTLVIANGMDTAREVLVRDRIPLSVNEKIQLEVKKIEPAPVERDPENRLTWKLLVQPGETKRIVVEFTLRYPGDEALIKY
ncbi:MAG: DUF4139 domain-containing protein [Synergistaceae bacterium]|nr:DUF4139 domain-containing protein [Synergistaceae bacterium]